MPFNRFDICAAYYIFCSLFHTGQNSWEYMKLSQLCRMKYKPGLTTEKLKFENENQFDIYSRLLEKARV